MIDPTYAQDKIRANPEWDLAFVLSEILNDSAPIGWSRQILTARCLLAAFDIKRKGETALPELSERIAREIGERALHRGLGSGVYVYDPYEAAAIIASHLPQPAAWQAIESAPKDGTHILFGRAHPWSSSSNICVGFWADKHQTNFPHWQTDNGFMVDTNIYRLWQPLPAPPPQEDEK